jgi:hypothetical protein
VRWELGSGQLAVELIGHDHRCACLGASMFGGPCCGFLYLLLTLDRSWIVGLLGQEVSDICLDLSVSGLID